MSAHPPVELDGDVEDEVARVAVAISGRLEEITTGMRATLGDAIVELVGDHRLVELLSRAVDGNVGTVLHMLRHHIPLSRVEVPEAAVAHARRLAQQGVPVFAMVRAYRLGQAFVLDECYAELTRGDRDPDLALRAFNAINLRILAYIDWVSQEVVTVYETERDRWVRTRDAARTAQVQEIVAGRAVAESGAEQTLHYRLRQHHVAAILWAEDAGSDGLAHLESATSVLAGELGGGLTPLGVAADGGATWVWFPRGTQAEEPAIAELGTALRVAGIDDVRVALGGVEWGIAGFRDSHRQAVEAQRVLLTGRPAGRTVIGHREPGVSAAALLARDLDHARLLVAAALGPLAAADESSERLRETLLGFLECGSSYTATAARFALHKNSVKYRIERALDQRGRPLGDDRIDVELALIACRWLGAGLVGS